VRSRRVGNTGATAPDDPLVAAAVLWRFTYSIIVLPLGAITMARYRRAR